MSLYDAFAGAGVTHRQLAAEAGVPLALLDSIDAGRQPLPLDLAGALSAASSVDVGTILGAAGKWTKATGPIPRAIVPPDPLSTGLLGAAPLAPTVPVALPGRSVFSAWAVGQGLGGGGSDGGIALVDRSLGVVASASFSGNWTPNDLCFGPGGLVYAFNVAGSRAMAASIFPSFATAADVADSNNPGIESVCFEPTTRTVWGACSQSPGGAYVLSSISPLASSRSVVNVAASAATLFGIVAARGKVYATAHSTEGRVVEIDPSTKAVTRVSTGPDMGGVAGLAWDGASTLLALGSGVYAVDLGTMVATSLSGYPAGGSLRKYVAFLRGAFWIGDQDNGTNFPRLVRATVSGSSLNVLATLLFSSSVAGAPGRVAVDMDGVFWLACPSEGAVRTFDGTATSGDPTIRAFPTGGRPVGLIVL